MQNHTNERQVGIRQEVHREMCVASQGHRCYGDWYKLGRHANMDSVLQDATWEKKTSEHTTSLDAHSSHSALMSLPLASFLSVPRAGLKQESTCRSFPSAGIIGMCHQAPPFLHYFSLLPLQSFFPPEDPLVSHVLTLWLTECSEGLVS